jgi:hypothetical protein
MKHKIYTLVIMLATIVFVSQSCKKEESVMENQESNNSELLGAQGGGEDNTEGLLINFINRLDLVREKPEYPGSNLWNYSQDSMIWYIEAALNYKYAFPNHQRSKLILDSMFIDIDIPDDGNYNISKLLGAYDKSLNIISEKYDNIEADHKLLVSVDYSIKNRDNKVLTLVAYIYFGKFGVYLPRGDWKIFGGDYGQGGICGTNTYLNYGATDRLEQEEFSANLIHQLDVFFTDKEYVTDMANGLTVMNNSFNYSPYNAGWLYGEGPINITQNPNYAWASCLTTYYMDQYELDIKEMSHQLVVATNKSVILFDVWVLINSNNTSNGLLNSHFMNAKTVKVGVAHPRSHGQLMNFIQ